MTHHLELDELNPILIAVLAIIALALAIAPQRALFFLSRSRRMAADTVMVRAYRALVLICFLCLMMLLYFRLG